MSNLSHFFWKGKHIIYTNDKITHNYSRQKEQKQNTVHMNITTYKPKPIFEEQNHGRG